MASVGEQVLAFEGAQGFGAYTSGGRDGDVVKVTNLNDSGEGSLRWALETLTGPRIVVFDVGGQIDLSDQIEINGDVTIAGQTAPGGITITGGRLHVVEDNVIIRGLNIRPGDDPDGQTAASRDGISIGNGLDGAPVSNVIVDSNSISWSLDEGISLFGTTSNVTLSNNIISEALNDSIHPEGEHGFGLFLSVASTEVSILGNLLAHHQFRNPAISEASDNIEVINNVVYNYGGGGLVAEPGINLNVINNLFIPGPDTTAPGAIRLFEGGGDVFLSGNSGSLTPDSDLTRVVTEPAFEPATLSVLATEDVLDAVLANAGAQAADRNAIDARVIQTVIDGTGSIIDSQDDVGGYLVHDGSFALPDADGDGIPDSVEDLLGSDPLVADANVDADNNGASNIEDYINGLLGSVPDPRPNAAPTGVMIIPVIDALNDDTDTTAPVKVADIMVLDDALGENILTLAGSDAATFEIVGTELFLVAGTVLNFETQASFDVTVQVDDPTLGDGPFDAASDFTLTILDADGNDAPQDVIVTPVLNALSETTDTTAPIKVADIAVIDDDLGENILTLGGTDASLFDIVGTELFLKAGVSLDFDQAMTLDVTVQADDPLVGDGPFDAVTDFSLAITEAPPFPTEPIRIAAEDPDAMLDTFRLESNGQRIGLPANGEGTATYTLTDVAAGTYSVTLGLWDEADGQSQVTVSLITGAETQVVDAFVMDDDASSSNLANNASFRERLLTNTITVTSGSKLEIAAIRDAGEGTRFDFIELTPIAPANLAPSAVTVSPVLTNLPEDADTSAPIKVADLAVVDDGLGTNTLSLAGADAALFEIGGTELFLKAGTALDFEANESLALTVQVDDPTVGGPVDAATNFSLTVTELVVNEAPTDVVLSDVLASLPEDTDTSAAIKVADIAVTDDGLGTNTLSLAGADAALFEIVGSELFLKAGTVLDFETQESFALTVQVDDPTVGGPVDAFAEVSLAVTDLVEVVNEAPTDIVLSNVVESLPEDTNTTTAIKLADIAITDDGLGTNTLSLAGADAALFEIVGSELFLKAGTILDFETQESFALTVQVDDPTVGGPVDAFAEFSLAVTDLIEVVNEAPTDIVLSNVVESLPEDTNTTTAIKLADIAITDDGLGTNTLSLAGADAALFEIVGTELFLKAGTVLDFETQESFALTVQVDDLTVGGPVDAFAEVSLAVTEVVVNEAPIDVVLSNVIDSLPEDADTTEAIKLADIAVTDDGLGTNTLSLAGADAALFEIVGTELFLKAGTVLDFESQESFALTVQVDDPTVGGPVDAATDFSLAVTDVVEVVNEAPTDVILTAVVDALPETADTSSPIKIADITIVDDGLGTNLLTLGGADAGNFEIVGTELFLRAGVTLDFDAQASFAVTVEVDDPLVGTGPVDAAAGLTLAIADVTQVPTDPIRIEAEGPDVDLDGFIRDNANARIHLPPNGTGTATVDLADVPTGTYTVTIGHYDENDGQSELTISLITPEGPQLLDFWVLNDEATSSDRATPSSFREREVSGTITVTDGTKLELAGVRGTGEWLRIDYIDLTPIGTDNIAPTAVEITPVISDLPEDIDTSIPIKVADISVVDDGVGVNALSLTGADAISFEIVGTALFLRAGVALDFETQARLDVVVQVNDPTVGAAVDASGVFSLDITDVFEPVNAPPTAVLLVDAVDTLPEDTDTTQALRLATIVIEDDGLGTNDLSLGGADAASFEIVGDGLFLKAGTALDFETKTAFDVSVLVDDPTLGAPVDASVAFTLDVADVFEPVNTPPTAVLLFNVLTTLPEDADTSEAIRIATVGVEDDDLGTNILSLGGADAASFELEGDGLFLKAGTALDFETAEAFDVTVFVDDPLVGDGTFDAAADITLTILDVEEPVNAAPTAVIVSTVLESLADNTDTSEPIKIADLSIVDDGLGTNLLDLSGADADMFDIIGSDLVLAAGADLDFDAQPSLDVTVQVDDPTVGTGAFDAATDVSLTITDGGDPVLQEVVIAVDASNDDWEQFSGGRSRDLELGEDGRRNQYVGVRFDDIDIPQGGTVVEAYLQFRAFETNTGNANYTIEIEDTENAATYSRQNDPADRDYADSFLWQNVEGWTVGQTYRTPDISDLINTVVGSDGANDAAFGFQITGTGSRAAITYDNNSALAPELVLIIESDTVL